MPPVVRLVFVLGMGIAAAAADDPFIGKWKLSLAKSKLTGQTIDIEEVAPDTWKFKEDEHSDVIFADGLDHLTHFGDSMAITKKSADTWTITYKRGDQVTMDTIWKISPDDRTLNYTVSGTRPNGQRFRNQMTLKRISGTSGLAGTWESVDVELSSPREIYIATYTGDGHSITFPGRKEIIRLKFDGKDYSDDGPTVPEGSTSSGHRIDTRTIETTEKRKGRVIEVARATISPDGQTQTIVVTEPDDKTPVVLVYERD
jgi:hypothetical protein